MIPVARLVVQRSGVQAQIVLPVLLIVAPLSFATGAFLAWASARWLQLPPPPDLPAPFQLAVVATALLAALVVGLACWLVARRVARPLAALAEATRLIAGGAKDTPMPQIYGSGEIPSLAGSLATLVAQLVTRDRQLAELAASVDRRIAERAAAHEKELASVIERLEQQSGTDALTGLANRRQFNDTLAREWQRALRYQIPLALMLVDIDHFKLYNDTYGHQQGDACLKRVGAALAQTIARGSDLAARYGGEEFGIILTHTEADGAWHAAQRLLDTVRGYRLPHRASSVANHVTVSVGIASLIPPEGAGCEELIRLSDEALYQAKESGRNRAVAAVFDPAEPAQPVACPAGEEQTC